MKPHAARPALTRLRSWQPRARYAARGLRGRVIEAGEDLAQFFLSYSARLISRDPERAREVAAAVADGSSNAEISTRLHISGPLKLTGTLPRPGDFE